MEGGGRVCEISNKPYRVNMSEKWSTWFVYGPIKFHYLSISYFSSWYAKTFPLPYLNRVNNLIETIAKVPNEVLVLLVVLEESFDFACKNKWKMMDLWSKQDESGEMKSFNRNCYAGSRVIIIIIWYKLPICVRTWFNKKKSSFLIYL